MVVPNSQKEGMIRGNGGGMMIDIRDDGVFTARRGFARRVHRAWMSSLIRDGSSDAGADELYAMMERESAGRQRRPAPSN